jgi:hypothetical protein
MTDPRFDARIRNALQLMPSPSAPETNHALRAVLDRSRRRRLPAWASIAAAAAITGILLLVALLAFGPDRDHSPQPSQSPSSGPAVEGTWQRTVRGAADDSWNGTWTVTLQRNGAMVLDSPTGARNVDDGAAFAVSGSQLRLDAFVNGVCPDEAPGTYGWSRTGGRLILVTITEPCAIRRDLFAGTWAATE